MDRLDKRPQTSKYRNQSHIIFGDQNDSKQQTAQFACLLRKKRPQSYRNVSRVAEFMNDSIQTNKQMEKVRYTNVVQNTDKIYEVPKKVITKIYQSSQQFHDLLQNNAGKLYKPIDQFTQYTDLLVRNANLLRRGQFDKPRAKEQLSTFKRTENQTKPSQNPKCSTKLKASQSLKFGNTIASSLRKSTIIKKSLRKQKEQFSYSTQKIIKPINKTFLAHVNQYESLINRQRQNEDKTTLKNAMSRVLTMQVMGKQIQNMTQLYY